MARKVEWTMPKWMEPYRRCLVNSAGNSVEELVNGNDNPLINLPLSTLQFGMKSQVQLLEVMHAYGMLPEVQ